MNDHNVDDDPGKRKPAPLYFKTVEHFYANFFRYFYQREINGTTRIWLARWWDDTEAVMRMDAMWRSWEQLRLDAGTGTSTWMVYHVDHHMGILFDPDGPLKRAGINSNPENCSRADQPLPHTPPPAGLFLPID